MRIHLARHDCEVAMRLAAAQHDHAIRRLGFEPLGDQASAGPRRLQTVEILGALDETDVAGTSHVEWRDIGDAVRKVGADARLRSGQRYDFAYGHPRRRLKKTQLAHHSSLPESTRNRLTGAD